MNEHYKFINPPLTYQYNALEPYIDTRTMEIHHDKHLQTYVDNLNKVLIKYPVYQKWSLEKLILNYTRLPNEIKIDVKNNAGGVYNHIFYFEGMSKTEDNNSGSELMETIHRDFGNYESFKKKLKQKALSVFGSGWAWLTINKFGKLQIISTANQDTVLTLRMCPILGVDVWEHAYYLKHYNKRAEYIDDWFNVINWNKAQKNYQNSKIGFNIK